MCSIFETALTAMAFHPSVTLKSHIMVASLYEPVTLQFTIIFYPNSFICGSEF